MFAIRFSVLAAFSDLWRQTHTHTHKWLKILSCLCDFNCMTTVKRSNLNPQTNIHKTIPCQWKIKDFEELGQRGLVHDIDHAHLCDKEVQDAPSGSNGTIFGLSDVDLDLCICRDAEFRTDFSSRLLGSIENPNHGVIINQRPLKNTFGMLSFYLYMYRYNYNYFITSNLLTCIYLWCCWVYTISCLPAPASFFCWLLHPQSVSIFQLQVPFNSGWHPKTFTEKEPKAKPHLMLWTWQLWLDVESLY